MGSVILAFAYALFVWWFSTGIVLLLVLRRGRTVAISLMGAAVVFPASLYVLSQTGNACDVAGAYAAFTAAILVWGTQELAFLTGVLTGPRPLGCPPGARGFRRASYAIGAILYHELGLILSGLAIVLVTSGDANQVGPMTFLILWIMRLSAKLNLFLGVPVLNDEMMPDHLVFLRSYFRRGPVNALLLPVMVLASLATALLLGTAFSSDAAPGVRTGSMLLAALLALAVLEHGFMIVRLPVDRLWRWSERGRVQSGSASGNAAAETHRREQPRDLGDIKRVLPTIP